MGTEKISTGNIYQEARFEVYPLPKDHTLREIREMIAAKYGVPPDNVELYPRAEYLSAHIWIPVMEVGNIELRID